MFMFNYGVWRYTSGDEVGPLLYSLGGVVYLLNCALEP